jgi:DNA-binding response OmpR family regulator
MTTQVLVVDDDIHILRAIRIHLTARGYHVLGFPS